MLTSLRANVAATYVILGTCLMSCGPGPTPSTLAADRLFTYSPGLVPGGLEGCEAARAGLAQRFAAATGTTVVTTDCAADTVGSGRLSLSYLAPERVRLVSAVFGLFGGDPDLGSGLDEPLWGVYQTLAGCFADAPAKRADFRAETGLDPIVATCDGATMGGFSLRVDGAGTAQRRFFEATPEYFGNADQQAAEAVAEVTRRLGGHVKGVKPWGGYVVTHYYAPTSLAFSIRTIGFEGQVNTAAECAAELAETVRIVRSLHDGAEPEIARCLPNSNDASHHLNFVPPLGVPTARYFETRGPIYGTYAACAADRQRVVELMATSSGKDYRGGVCVRPSSVDLKSQLILVGT